MIELIVAGLILVAASAEPEARDGLAGSGRDSKAYERELQGSVGGEVFRSMQNHYPDEYRALIENLMQADTGRDPAMRAKQRNRAVVSFYRRRADGLANAPPELLEKINARQLELIRRLARQDARLCAEFATTALIGRFDLPASYQLQASALGALMIEAAKAGEARPHDPTRKGLGIDDAASWYAQLLQMESSREVQTTIAVNGDDGNGTPEIQCRVGVAVHAAIAKLPPDQAANVAAFFLTQTLAELGTE